MTIIRRWIQSLHFPRKVSNSHSLHYSYWILVVFFVFCKHKKRTNFFYFFYVFVVVMTYGVLQPAEAEHHLFTSFSLLWWKTSTVYQQKMAAAIILNFGNGPLFWWCVGVLNRICSMFTKFVEAWSSGKIWQHLFRNRKWRQTPSCIVNTCTLPRRYKCVLNCILNIPSKLGATIEDNSFGKSCGNFGNWLPRPPGAVARWVNI